MKNIPIGDARELARKNGVPMVVVFAVNPDGSQYAITTYGMTKALCKLAASYGDQFADAVMKGSVSAPEFEPEPGIGKPAVRYGDKARD